MKQHLPSHRAEPDGAARPVPGLSPALGPRAPTHPGAAPHPLLRRAPQAGGDLAHRRHQVRLAIFILFHHNNTGHT